MLAMPDILAMLDMKIFVDMDDDVRLARGCRPIVDSSPHDRSTPLVQLCRSRSRSSLDQLQLDAGRPPRFVGSQEIGGMPYAIGS